MPSLPTISYPPGPLRFLSVPKGDGPKPTRQRCALAVLLSCAPLWFSIYALRAHNICPKGPFVVVGFGRPQSRRRCTTPRWGRETHRRLPFGDASLSESQRGYAPLWFGFASRLAGDDGKNQRGAQERRGVVSLPLWGTALLYMPGGRRRLCRTKGDGPKPTMRTPKGTRYICPKGCF